MKKIIISMMAVAALATCTKSEVQYEPAGEIAFAPVAKNVTKSVAGYNGNTFDGVFPTDIDLYVFANAGTGDVANHDEEYFKNALFEWNSSKGVEGTQGTVSTPGAYAGNPTRYWPNVKTLVFAGYSNACNVATLDTKPSMNFDSNELTITGYTQDNTQTAEGANDLMWFACDGQAYSKQADEIAANMQHACSWITIKVAADANMVSSKCQLNSLKLNSFYHTGNVVCGEDAAEWNTLSNSSEEYYLNTSAHTLSATATAFETTPNNFIVIPQEPVMLDVTYTYVSDAANNITTTETKPVSLSYTTTEPTEWQNGVNYIYTITITASEILIDPVVKEWDDQTYDLGNI